MGATASARAPKDVGEAVEKILARPFAVRFRFEYALPFLGMFPHPSCRAVDLGKLGLPFAASDSGARVHFTITGMEMPEQPTLLQQLHKAIRWVAGKRGDFREFPELRRCLSSAPFKPNTCIYMSSLYRLF